MTLTRNTMASPLGSGPPIGVALLTHCPTPVIQLDEQLVLIARNPAAEKLFGTDDHWFDRWLAGAAAPDAEHSGWRDVFTDALARTAVERYEGVRWTSADDRSHVVNLNLVPHAQDDQASLIVMVEDVTRETELAQKLAATEDMAAVGRLAARVAHELNNPLDGALRYVNLAARLLEKHPPTDEAGTQTANKLNDYLVQVRAGLHRMTQIVADLLAFSRNMPVVRESGNINRVVEEALHAMSDHADNHGVAVMADFHNDKQMPTLQGTKLYQVCCNLIKNAIDAMPDGGCLTVHSGIVDGFAILRFEDSGPGLPDDTERLFEAFYTTKPQGSGTGLGLAICREYIEQLGGSIHAENGKSEGAVFTVRIPVNTATPTASAHTVKHEHGGEN